MKSKTMCISTLCIVLALLLAIGGVTAVYDPFFHFHGPREGQDHRLYSHRYQNDGITRHFEYDTVIIGTSMTECFRTSVCEELFGGSAIKIPFSGASYKELDEALVRAIGYNPEIRTVFRGVDLNRMIMDKDYMRYESYPDYLYDQDPFNDVNYLFNKDIFVEDVVTAIEYDREADSSYTFDRYSNWSKKYTYGKDAVLSQYKRRASVWKPKAFTAEDERIVRENIAQNVTAVIASNPQIEFYIFFPPYSIVYWDSLHRQGDLERYIRAQAVAMEMILQYDNVHLFGFFDDTQMICDLDNYKDTLHYHGDINDQMLRWMHDGEHQLTLENYEAYLQEMYEFYSAYDYDSLFK